MIGVIKREVNNLKNLTKKKAIAEHRKMWNWIADEALKRKEAVSKMDYFNYQKIFYDKRPLNNCYCCEFAKVCDYCPIDWPGEKACLDENGPYIKWRMETDWKKSAKYAREIANLPEKRIIL